MTDRFVGLRQALVAVAEPERAEPMAAYLKGRFVCLGVRGPNRKVAQKPLLAAGKQASADDLLEDARALWSEPEREFQYVAVDDLRRWGKKLGPEHLVALRGLVVAKSWWDTVDALAVHVVGGLVRRHPELQATMDVWVEDPNLWVARTALLHQLMWKEDTDQARLFTYCRLQMAHTDFFIRKAIGWALRQYARTAPGAVRAFVEAHHDELSGLSRREALKHLG